MQRSVVTGAAIGVAAVLVAAGALWLAWLLGGGGALLFVAVSGGCVALLRSWRVGCAAAALAMLVWSGVSFVRYVATDNGETVTSRAATWARDHGLGPVVDRMEAWTYDEPPSAAPAPALQVATVPPMSSVAAPPSIAPTASTAPASSVPPTEPTEPTTPGTTAPAPTGPPAPLPPQFSPALPGEGSWRPVAQAGGQDAMWATGIRPLPGVGGVVATVVAIDQSHLRAGLFNGSELPGGTWRRGNRVPKDLWPALRGAMNGGFRFEHIRGGYVTEGVVVKPLHEGDATIAIDRSGHVVIGALGRDLQDDGSWASLRQNLTLMVDGGRTKVREGIARGVWWGADNGREVYVLRSGVCELRNGLLAYVLAAPVDAQQFADVMVAVGCETGMQLDINGTWPAFDVYSMDDGRLVPTRLDERMSPNTGRYLNGSSKEFVAFFDAADVPVPSVLDD